MDRIKHTRATGAHASPPDEVVTLGLRWHAMQERMEDLSCKQYAATKAHDLSAEAYFCPAVDIAVDEIDAVRAMLPFTQATSLSGASIQIMEAMNVVDAVLDQLPQETPNYRISQQIRAIDLLLHSALNVVNSLADHKLADIMPMIYQVNLNPWTPVEDRLAAIRTERVGRCS